MADGQVETYYTLLDLPYTVSVDESALKKAYHILSRESHPDYHSHLSAEDQEAVLQRSTMVNQAYKTLKDLDKRLQYILAIEGQWKDGDEAELDPMFLMEMMELNEAVMEADEENAEKIREQILGKDFEAFEALGDLLTKPIDGFGQEDWDRIKGYYFQRRYLLRVIKNLNNLAGL
jgi:molecular chaperone HscB